jgi:hypothetical protein
MSPFTTRIPGTYPTAKNPRTILTRYRKPAICAYVLGEVLLDRFLMLAL